MIVTQNKRRIILEEKSQPKFPKSTKGRVASALRDYSGLGCFSGAYSAK